jgi:hypothetical protein
MKITELECPHCKTKNVVAQCPNCDRYFVLINDYLDDSVRKFESKPIEISKIPSNFTRWCDFCTDRKPKQLAKSISSGLSQRTCPTCHTEFLSSWGL